MIQLTSYGDKLALGNYRPHSRFKRAANFVSGDSLICCVDNSIGPGPFNIVIEGASLDSIRSIVIEKLGLAINGESLELERANRYCSEIEWSTPVVTNKVIENIDYFRDSLSRLSNPLSLAFLINGERESHFSSKSEIEYIRRFKGAADSFLSIDFIDGVKRLRGLGYGLTPSGDDFIAGALTALNLSQVVSEKDNSKKMSQIYRAACGENPLVNAFLYCSLAGQLPLRMKNLAQTILHGNRAAIYGRTRELLDMGETSGADWGVGFYLTMQAEFDRGEGLG